MSKKRLLVIGGSLLVVVAVAAAIVSGVRYWSMNAEEQARDSAVSAATEYATTMFGLNSSNVQQNVDKAMAFSTGDAKNQLQKQIVDGEVVRKIKDQKVVTVVTIEGAGVMSNTRDTAKVLLFMNQSSTRNTTEDVQIDASRLIYDMVRRDGRWLITSMEILDDDSLSSRVKKADGSTPPSGAVPIPSSSTPVPAPTP